MKKLLIIMLIAAMSLSMVACGKKDDSSSDMNDMSSSIIEESSSEEKPVATDVTLESSLSDIMSNIIDVPSMEIGTMESEMTADNWEYNTKTTMPEGAEGYVSDAMIGSQAHSVVLIRVAEGTDAQAYADEIKEKHSGTEPSKWVCVDPEKVEVVVKGNLILFVQSFENTADEIVAKFNEIK